VITIFAAAVFSVAAFAQTSGSASGSATGTVEPTAKPGTEATASQSAATSQSTSMGNQAANASTAQTATLNATLSKSIDAKKAKQGDEVVAKTTQDTTTSAGTRIPKNTKLIGHVTDVKAKTKGDAQSSLGFVFDKAVLKGGQEVPLHAVIQAVAEAPQVPMGVDAGAAAAGPDPGMGAPNAGSSGSMGSRGNANGGVAGGAANTVGGVANTATGAVDNAAGATGAATQAGMKGVSNAAALNANSTGVIGMKGLQLQQATGASAAGSAPSLVNTNGNVHLDSGTQLVLKLSSVSAGADASAAKQ